MTSGIAAIESPAPGKRGVRFGERVLVAIEILVFVVAYHSLYIHWLSPTWAYFGMMYVAPPPEYEVLAWALALLPCLWLPLSLRRPSQFIYWVLYFVVYVPSMFGPLYMALRPRPEIAEFMLTLAAGFAIVGAGYLVPVLDLAVQRLPRVPFWGLLLALALGFNIWMIAVFHGEMRLVSFADIYGLRSRASEIIHGGALGYALLLLAMALNPFFMAVGSARRRTSLLALGAVSQVLLYMSLGLKGVLLSIPVTLGGYLLARHAARRFAAALTAFMAGGFTLLLWVSQSLLTPTTKLFKEVLSFVVMRAFGTPGMLSGEYEAFFSHKPLTYFSHVKLVKLFIPYPYHGPLGIEIGAFFKTSSINENAHLWASDGMAALGFGGILLISVVAAVVFWLLDSAARTQPIAFATACIAYTAFQLTNIPLTTTVWSGGLGVLMLLLWFMPRLEKEPAAVRTKVAA
jgi:hypothetical protein